MVRIPRLPRGLGEAAISVGALGALLMTLVAVDDRVREQVSIRFSAGGASEQLAAAGAQVRDLGAVIMGAARDQSISHAPLLIFVLAATVLVLFMLRT
jgi:hypothetical protein